MTQEDQMDHFTDDLDKLIERYRKEYDMTFGGMIGVLQIKVYDLCKEADEGADQEVEVD